MGFFPLMARAYSRTTMPRFIGEEWSMRTHECQGAEEPFSHMNWPPQSPDFTPLKVFWMYWKRLKERFDSPVSDIITGRRGPSYLPVALVPDPAVLPGLGAEVSLAVVVDLGGETQQPPVGVGACGVGCAGEAVLLVGAEQHEHGPILQVRGRLHHLGIQNQVRRNCVWGGGGGRTDAKKPVIPQTVPNNNPEFLQAVI